MSSADRKTTKLPLILPTSVDTNIRKLFWDQELSENSELFGLHLFLYLTQFESENFMINPYLIHSLLAVLAEGAVGNTYKEINNALGLINRQRTRDFHQYTNLALSKSASNVNFRKFAAMIGDQNRPITREYEDNLEKIYDVEYIPVNFKNVDRTLREVNGRVSQSTSGLITDVISREDVLKTQLILLACTYFKGSWKIAFNATLTKYEPFYDINEERIIGRVNMMSQSGSFAYVFNQNLGCYLLELPFGIDREYAKRINLPESAEDRISMIVVLPKRGLSLTDVINNISIYGIKTLLIELKKSKEENKNLEVEVHFPRFEINTSLNLKETLKYLEINEIFENTANLSGINYSYYVSSILHKTKINVDEKGSEARTVTNLISANKVTFYANRPFIYFILDKATRLILFAGVFKNPAVF